MRFVGLKDIHGDDILINPSDVSSLAPRKIRENGGVITQTVMTMKSGNRYEFSGWPSFVAGQLGASVQWSNDKKKDDKKMSESLPTEN